MNRALVLCVIVLLGFPATPMAQPESQPVDRITSRGKDAYVINVSPVLPARGGGLARAAEVKDLDVLEARAREEASAFCAKLGKTMLFTDSLWDEGVGLNIYFSCVPPKPNAP